MHVRQYLIYIIGIVLVGPSVTSKHSRISKSHNLKEISRAQNAVLQKKNDAITANSSDRDSDMLAEKFDLVRLGVNSTEWVRIRHSNCEYIEMLQYCYPDL